jgi:hypothetical protein
LLQHLQSRETFSPPYERSQFSSEVPTGRDKDLPWFNSQIIAGQVLSATIPSLFEFRTNQLHSSDVAEISSDLSYAKLHSLSLRAIRRYTNSLPLDPAMLFEKLGYMGPTF